VALSAPVMSGQAHQGPRQAMTRPASAAIICPPPSGDGAVVAMSKTGDPGCAVHSGRINSCPDPDCVRGVPPVAVSAMECTDPRCVSGTQPATAPRPRSRVNGRTGHGEPPAAAWPQAAARTSTVSASQINCPPAEPQRDPRHQRLLIAHRRPPRSRRGPRSFHDPFGCSPSWGPESELIPPPPRSGMVAVR
jgi:hypothetical protein